MSFLFFMVPNAHAQEWCAEDFSNCEESCYPDQKNFYAKIFSGVNCLQNTTTSGNKATYNAGYMIAGSVGYCWRYGLNVECEYAYRRNGISKIQFFEEGSSAHGYFQTSSIMANLLWDLPLSSWVCKFWYTQPFIGAGLGYDFQHMHSSNSRIVFDQKWHHFSWQLMAGLTYPIFCNTEIALEYIFHQGGCHFYNHSVGVGLLYKFGFLRRS